MKSALDSINKSMDWISSEASNFNVSLNFKIHEKNKNVYALYKSKMSYFDNYYEKHYRNQRAYFVLRKLSRQLPKDSSAVKVRYSIDYFYSRLEQMYHTNNIAVLFFIKSNRASVISESFNTTTTKNKEYALIYFCNPSIIAHGFLHLYGALDLYDQYSASRLNEYGLKTKTERLKDYAQETFPNDIMVSPIRDISKLEISEYTGFLIGWKENLSKDLKHSVLGKNIKPETNKK
jgi:hypothetical protein